LCKVYEIELPAGRLQTYHDGTRNVPIQRPEGSETPCDICPKGGPENEAELMLSADNGKTVAMYQRLQAPGQTVPKHLHDCELFAENYSVVRTILAEADRKEANESLAYEVAALLIRTR
jgi:hypothetical protein